MVDEILLNRVKDGNQKLFDVLTKARECWDQGDAEGYERFMSQIDRAWPKLDRLCIKLQASGFEICLYDQLFCEQGEAWFCYVCPETKP